MTKPPDQKSPRRPPTIPYAGGSPSVAARPVNAPPEPPLPPRGFTPAVKWRSWTEPRIRFWWLASLVLLAIGIWFVADQLLASRTEADLIRNGKVVTATVNAVDGDSRVGKKNPPGSPLTLKFDWPGTNGQSTVEYVSGVLNAASDKDFIVTGQQVQIHVDPNDVSRWTDRTQAEPMSRRLIAGAVIFPVVLATGITALLLRRRVLRIWREGEADVFSVVDTHHSALAPLSHTVRAVAVAGHDRRLVTVCLPGRLPRPQKGEALWLIHPRGKPMSSIAAAAFEGGAPVERGA